MKVVIIENNSRFVIASGVALKVARSIKKAAIDIADKFVVVRIVNN